MFELGLQVMVTKNARQPIGNCRNVGVTERASQSWCLTEPRSHENITETSG
jgi:hypothetical protein